ncbi:MAG: hypothetical protein HC857_16080 [Synechococcales cyanobacterium RU_4_20]|nr:hypothetical protein [Synechococcales cyanobacterium RU_4_20]NJR67827.1 hypothetical protein [Synechococcales cyanobacterium CRU_2_2]
MFLSRYTAIAFILFAMLFPVRTPCQGGELDCNSLPDYRGRVRPYYDIRPFSVTVIEQLTGSSVPILYRRTQSLL